MLGKKYPVCRGTGRPSNWYGRISVAALAIAGAAVATMSAAVATVVVGPSMAMAEPMITGSGNRGRGGGD